MAKESPVTVEKAPPAPDLHPWVRRDMERKLQALEAKGESLRSTKAAFDFDPVASLKRNDAKIAELRAALDLPVSIS